MSLHLIKLIWFPYEATTEIERFFFSILQVGVATISYNRGSSDNPDPFPATVIFAVNNLSSFLGVPPDITRLDMVKDGTPVAFGTAGSLFNIYSTTNGDEM